VRFGTAAIGFLIDCFGAAGLTTAVTGFGGAARGTGGFGAGFEAACAVRYGTPGLRAGAATVVATLRFSSCDRGLTGTGLGIGRVGGRDLNDGVFSAYLGTVWVRVGLFGRVVAGLARVG
jgi:hypothetical protein